MIESSTAKSVEKLFSILQCFKKRWITEVKSAQLMTVSAENFLTLPERSEKQNESTLLEPSHFFYGGRAISGGSAFQTL